MRVAVVTPYYKEPLAVLRRCVDSVKAQQIACAHIMVADGHPRPEIEDWGVEQHVKLPLSHADDGDTPRLIGTGMAHAQGFDAVCWLDADNWFEAEHVSS